MLPHDYASCDTPSLLDEELYEMSDLEELDWPSDLSDAEEMLSDAYDYEALKELNEDLYSFKEPKANLLSPYIPPSSPLARSVLSSPSTPA